MDSIFLQMRIEGEVLHWEWDGKAVNRHVWNRRLVVIHRALVVAIVIFVHKQPLTSLEVVLECQIQVPVLITAL